MNSLMILIILFPTLLWAQAPAEAEEEILRNPSSVFPTGPVGTAEVRQEGLDNQAIIQTQDSYVRVQQSGEAHDVQLTQAGQNGQMFIQQEGARNQYSSTVLGDNNRLDITQRGEDNLIRQDLVGNDLRYRIVQEGRGHELIQLEHDPLAPAYEVHQQGQSMQITIDQGFVGLPPSAP